VAKLLKKYPVLSQLNALVRCHVVECDKCVWRRGSAQTCWGSFSAHPVPLTAIGGGILFLREREKGERKGKGKGGRGKGRARTGNLPVKTNFKIG